MDFFAVGRFRIFHVIADTERLAFFKCRNRATVSGIAFNESTIFHCRASDAAAIDGVFRSEPEHFALQTVALNMLNGRDNKQKWR